MLKAFHETLELAKQLGATVETMHLPHSPHALAAYYLIAPAECSSNLARYDGVRYGFRKPAKDLLSMYTADARGGLRRRGQAAHPDRHLRAVQRLLRRLLRQGAEGPHADLRGLQERLRRVRLHRHADRARASPSSWARRPSDPLAMYLNDFCTVPMSLAGIPAISIPNGLSEGLPVGFQLAGPAFSENRILDAAFALEQAIGFDGRKAFA